MSGLPISKRGLRPVGPINCENAFINVKFFAIDLDLLSNLSCASGVISSSPLAFNTLYTSIVVFAAIRDNSPGGASSLNINIARIPFFNHAGTPASCIKSPGVFMLGKPYGNKNFCVSENLGVPSSTNDAGIAATGPIPGTTSNAKFKDPA